MKYCEYCGAMLEDDAQCTCPGAQQAQGFAGQQPSGYQQGGYQQPGDYQQGGYQQPGDYQQGGYQQPGGYQQGGYQQPGGYQQGGYQQPGGYQPGGYQQQPGGYQQGGYQQNSQQREEAQRKMAEAQKKAKAAANGLIGYLKAYFNSPSEAVRSYLTGEGMMVSIILTVARVLSVWLAVFGVLNKMCSMASSAMGMYSYGFSSYMVMPKISAPILGSLLYGGLIAIVCMALFIVCLFAVVKIQKGTLSFVTVWQASANNSVLPTALLLLAFLVSFVSLSIALVLICLSIVASLTFGVLTAQYVYDGNKTGLYWLLFFAAVVVITIATYYIVPMLALKAVGGISVTYNGRTETLGPAIEQMQQAFSSGGGLEGFLEEIMGSAF